MRARHLPYLGLVLLLCAALPLRTHGGQAACCNVSGSERAGMFPGGNGDEQFFAVPNGPPNVMVLLDSSGSMLDFPTDIKWPSSYPASKGTCTGTSLNAFTAKRSNTPYDNGFTLGTLTDTPPWGLASCTAVNSCLFRPTSYYKGPVANSSGSQTARGKWNTSTATEYASGSAVGQICGKSTSTSSDNPTDATECQACLESQGFYLFKDSSGYQRSLLKGDFLNGYPPKHVIARKVVKNMVAIDPNSPSPLDTVRFGLTTFVSPASHSGLSTSLSSDDGGVLQVPLGPDCATAYPPLLSNFLPARQAILSVINDPTKVAFNANTPLAETLFNIGQYFTNSGVGSYYQNHFGSSWVRSSFDEDRGGTIGASWAANNKSFCWACQQSSVVIVTDGEPNNDSNLPASPTPASNHSAFNDDFRKWTNATIACASCGNDLSGSPANALHKVAYFLHTIDLRSDFTNPASQNVSTYTISFGIDPVADAKAIAVLQKTADLGGGFFANASSGDELEQFLYSAITDVVARSTSFSVANTNTLQSGSGSQLFLARFKPHQGPAWEGHLYRFMLFSENAMGCDLNKKPADQVKISCGSRNNPNLNGDVDPKTGNAKCDGIFIVDQACDPVMEDSTGNFVKATFDASGNLQATASAAAPFWDAASLLASTAASSRVIKTVIDRDGDGKFTASDGMLDFSIANVSSVAPYMDLSETWCRNLYSRIGLTAPAAGAWADSDTLTCARQVIYYIRGYDVLDADNDDCAGPENSTASGCTGKGEERDPANDSANTPPEFSKLGDIFHSSPAIVDVPAPPFLCDLGASGQCLPTLHGSKSLTHEKQTPLDPPGDDGKDNAYDLYRKGQLTRRRVVLVGANDGMLHAFDAGSATGTKDAFGGYQYDAGTGKELWAFIPPDLLPRLKYALDGHQYFVDGNTAVRDIWVDANSDGKKQQIEFHTVAVMSERSGGTHFVGLDVTDPINPSFIWSFPDDCTLDGNQMGQSWTSFTPLRPPIGPVKIAASNARGFDEKWIIFLNGGYDPSLTRGRGVWMLDAWSGKTVWSFTNDDFKAQLAGSSGAGMGPVPGTVAMVDVGRADQPNLDLDGFFDTAMWGDMNGQLFLARMQDPGVADGNGRVSNDQWAAARAFEQERQSDGSQIITLSTGGRHEFFEMPANVWDATFGALHTYLGTGNREHLMQQTPECGPDNMLGCCDGGCANAEVTLTENYGACSLTSHFKCASGKLQYDATTTNGSCSGTFACSSFSSAATLTRTCGAQAIPTVTASMSCDANGLCNATPLAKGQDLPASRLSALSTHNRFYGLWTYSADRAFNNTTGAKAYDASRFTDVPFTGCTGPVGGKCQVIDTTHASVTFDSVSGLRTISCGKGSPCSATSSDPGWMYEYGDRCPTSSCTSTPPWLDEKTATTAEAAASCVIWNTFRPLGSAQLDPCAAGSVTTTSFTYLADAVSGTPREPDGNGAACGFVTGNSVNRAQSRSNPEPPKEPVVVIDYNPVTHQVIQKVLQFDQGAQSMSSAPMDSNQPGYWLEVPRDLHSCRHVNNTTCE